MLTTFDSTVDGAAYTTGAINATANRLLIVAVATQSRGSNLVKPAVSGLGLTWKIVQSVTFRSGTIRQRLDVFRAMPTSQRSGAFTIKYTKTQEDVHVAVHQVANVVKGSNGGNAIFASAQALGTGTVGQVSVSGDVSTRTLAIFAVGVADDLTPEPEFLELSETRHVGLPSAMMTQWRDTVFDATTSATWATSTSWGAVAIAVKKA
jgi:hypothetical protein